MVAIFGLVMTGIEIKAPRIKPSKIKEGIEVSHRRINFLADSSLDILVLPLVGYYYPTAS